MALGWIFGLLFFAAMVVASVFCGIGYYKAYDAYDDNEAKPHKRKGNLCLLTTIVMLILFICVPFSFHTVDTGEVAVVKFMGKVNDVKTPGTYWDFWMFNSYQTYDGKVQNIDINTAAYSSDAQTMTISMTLQYQVMTDKVTNIASQYGSLDALTTRINSIATEKTKSVLSGHKAMDIIANRQDMSPAVEEAIRDAIGEEYFVNVVAVVLTDIEFSEQFETAVEEKMIAEQAKLKADYENETKIAKAEADAKAKIMAAEAEAKANELLEKTLTDKILQEMYIDKWDGKLPDVMTGDNTGVMIPYSADEE